MIAAFVALLTSVLLTWGMCYCAKHLGAVAERDPHVATHTAPTPLLGGVGILGGMAAGIGVQHLELDKVALIILLAPLFTLGFMKDVFTKNLTPTPQFCVEFLAAFALLAWTIGAGLPNFIILLVGAMLIAAFVNAINFLDVSDGLAGTVSTIICIVSAVMMYMLEVPQVTRLAVVFACAILGFLVWNRPKASIFMGDLGAFGIAAVIVYILLQAWRSGAPLAVLALICFVPFGEMAFAVAARLAQGSSPFKGDARHLSLTLLRRGWNPWSILFLFAVATVGSGMAALDMLSKSHAP